MVELSKNVIKENEILEVEYKYSDGYAFDKGEKTRAYKTIYRYFPSGQRAMWLVWSHKLNKCIFVKADYFEIVNRIEKVA